MVGGQSAISKIRRISVISGAGDRLAGSSSHRFIRRPSSSARDAWAIRPHPGRDSFRGQCPEPGLFLFLVSFWLVRLRRRLQHALQERISALLELAMTDPFRIPKRRIAHAKKCIDDMGRESTAFMETNPYARVVEHDADGTSQLYKIKLIKPLPEAIEDAAAGAVEDLRAALDQAMFAVAVSHRQTKTQVRLFPHCRFRDRAGKGYQRSL